MVEIAQQAMRDFWGNPSSAHALGAEAARKLAHARAQVAAAIGADPSEILFTSGGTEANALGFVGAAQIAERRGKHLVVSALEHPSIAEAARSLGERGFTVAVAHVDRGGRIDLDKFPITPETTVCALIWVQNEIGTVQSIAELVQLIRARAPRCHIHLDAVQALGKIPVAVTALGVDSLALSAHKIHGPKGVGALWLRRGARISPLHQGGGQEGGLRSGTENMPGIVALGLAAELAEASRRAAAPEMERLREKLWTQIAASYPRTVRHGANPAPHILSVGFPNTPAEPLLHSLESHGVCVSAGSACHARSKKPSATLRAIGVTEHMGTIRFSLSRETTEADIDRALSALTAAVSELGVIKELL